MKIVITGGNGMVARAVALHCSLTGDHTVVLRREDLDIADGQSVSRVIRRESPDVLLNCAAFTDVDGAESQPEVCYAVNAVGVKNLAESALEAGAVFLTISTDYVFDGEKDGFYSENDEPNPGNVYARSKLEGERLAAEANGRSIVIRTGWIFGKGGTNFLSVMNSMLAAGKEIKAIRDSFGTPTYAFDLAVRLRELAELDDPGTYHVVNSGAGTSYAGFAETICEAGGIDKSLVISVSESEIPRPAPRPKNSRLACPAAEKLGLPPLPRWKDAVERFLLAE